MKKEKCTPDFLVPGFAKSGTSSLHEYLNQHPDILMSSNKEPHNYSWPDNYKKRYELDSKRSFPNIFNEEEIKHHILLGESSTSYTVFPNSPELIYEDNPDMKFIVIVRDPIERIRSHYNWLLTLGYVEKDFRSEVSDWAWEKYDVNNRFRGNYKYYIEYSKYGSKLQNYLAYFDIKKFHFLSLENLKKHPKIELEKCFSFLGLDENVSIEKVIANKTQKEVRERYKLPKGYSIFRRLLPAQLKKKLKDKFAKRFIVDVNYKPIKALDKKDIIWLKEILNDEIDLFKELTNNNFPEWENFNT